MDVRLFEDRRSFRIEQPGIASAKIEEGADASFFLFGLVKIDPDLESWPEAFLTRMFLAEALLAENRHRPSRGLRVSPVIACLPFLPASGSGPDRPGIPDRTPIRYRFELLADGRDEPLATTSLEVTIHKSED